MVHSHVAKWSLNKGQNRLCPSSLSQQTITHLDGFMTQRVYHDMIDLIMVTEEWKCKEQLFINRSYPDIKDFIFSNLLMEEVNNLKYNYALMNNVCSDTRH